MAAAAKSNLKKVTMELGGKSPFIICADADVDKVQTHTRIEGLTQSSSWHVALRGTTPLVIPLPYNASLADA